VLVLDISRQDREMYKANIGWACSCLYEYTGSMQNITGETVWKADSYKTKYVMCGNFLWNILRHF
jgi:hypothetical protein